MALSADALLDRLRLKRQLTRWRVAVIVILTVLAISYIQVATGHSGLSGLGQPYVARLTIEGIITDDRKRDELIEDMREDTNVKAVILWIDTPGGTAVGGEQLYYELRRLAEVKPVVAVMRSMATSAGYMTALGADQIFALEGTITGSIGVILQTAEFSELATKIGVTPITIKSGELKGSPSPMEKMTDKETAYLQGVVNDFFEQFISMVMARRGFTRQQMENMLDGRVFTGRQALDQRLIDAIGGEPEALQWLAQNRQIDASLPVEDVKVKEEFENIFDEMSQSVASKILPDMLVRRLDGLLAIWQPNAL